MNRELEKAQKAKLLLSSQFDFSLFSRDSFLRIAFLLLSKHSAEDESEINLWVFLLSKSQHKKRKLYVCYAWFLTDIITKDNLSKCIQSLLLVSFHVIFFSSCFVGLTLSCYRYQSHASFTQSLWLLYPCFVLFLSLDIRNCQTDGGRVSINEIELRWFPSFPFNLTALG